MIWEYVVRHAMVAVPVRASPRDIKIIGNWYLVAAIAFLSAGSLKSIV